MSGSVLPIFSSPWLISRHSQTHTQSWTDYIKKMTWFNFHLNESYIFTHVFTSAQWVMPKGNSILKQNTHILFLWSWACRTFVNMKKKRAYSNLWCNQETEAVGPSLSFMQNTFINTRTWLFRTWFYVIHMELETRGALAVKLKNTHSYLGL